MAAAEKTKFRIRREHADRLPPSLRLRMGLSVMIQESLEILSLGRRAGQQRRLPLASGQVVLLCPQSEIAAHIAKRMIAWSRSWRLFGRARVLAAEIPLTNVEPQESRTERSDRTPLPTAWLLVCAPGRERDLERGLRRIARTTTDGFEPPPIVVRVPLLVPASTVPAQGQVTVHIGGTLSAGAPVTLGIFDTDIDQSQIPNAQIRWLGTIVQGGPNEGLHVSNEPADCRPQSHGTAVAAIASTVYPCARIWSVGYQDSGLRDVFRGAASAAFLFRALDLLKDCDVINVSMTVDSTVEDVAKEFEFQVGWVIRALCDRDVVIVASVGKVMPAYELTTDSKYREVPPRQMGYPASEPAVMAVGSLDATMRPSRGERQLGKKGTLHWITIGGDGHHPLASVDDQPWTGSSASTALVSGLACALLGTQHLDPQRSAQSRRSRVVIGFEEMERPMPGPSVGGRPAIVFEHGGKRLFPDQLVKY